MWTYEGAPEVGDLVLVQVAFHREDATQDRSRVPKAREKGRPAGSKREHDDRTQAQYAP